MTKSVTVEVAEATYDLVSHVAVFLAEAYSAAADGFQPLHDVPVVLQSAMINLVPQMTKVSAVLAEAKADIASCVYAVLVAAKPVLDKIKT